jgi:hypothetical protein
MDEKIAWNFVFLLLSIEESSVPMLAWILVGVWYYRVQRVNSVQADRRRVVLRNFFSEPQSWTFLALVSYFPCYHTWMRDAANHGESRGVVFAACAQRLLVYIHWSTGPGRVVPAVGDCHWDPTHPACNLGSSLLLNNACAALLNSINEMIRG